MTASMIEENQILLQSMVSRRIWDLYETDKQAFMREVKEYFVRGYPGYKVKKASYEKRIVWLAKGE